MPLFEAFFRPPVRNLHKAQKVGAHGFFENLLSFWVETKVKNRIALDQYRNRFLKRHESRRATDERVWSVSIWHCKYRKM